MDNQVTLAGELVSSLWISIPVMVLFGACELLYHVWKVEGEVTRKISHVGAGFVVLSMPWVAHTHWTVLALAGGFAIVLGGSKLLGLLPSVHHVARKTSGAQLYPIAVYVTFVLADGNALLYQVPMLVMALSDTGAAVVGRRYGIVRYRVIEDTRSLGGSVTFFALTFTVVLIGLSLAGMSDLPSVLLIALLTSMVATAVEGVSVHGADNLLVPYATFVVLGATLHAGREALGSWILGTALVLAILFVSFRQARLSTTGFMALFVGGVLAWGLGGPVWLATLLVPYVGYAATREPSEGRDADLRRIVPAFAVSLVLVLAFGHTHVAVLFVPFVASVASVSAIALAGFVRSRWPGARNEALAAFAGATSALGPALFLATPEPLPPAAMALAIGGALLGPLCVRGLDRTRISPGLARIAGVAFGTSGSLLWVFQA